MLPDCARTASSWTSILSTFYLHWVLITDVFSYKMKQWIYWGQNLIIFALSSRAILAWTSAGLCVKPMVKGKLHARLTSQTSATKSCPVGVESTNGLARFEITGRLGRLGLGRWSLTCDSLEKKYRHSTHNEELWIENASTRGLAIGTKQMIKLMTWMTCLQTYKSNTRIDILF